MVMVKKRLLNILLKIKKFENKIPKINAETCQKKKKKQKREYKRHRYRNRTEDKKRS